jgi:hypothetical protein
MAFSGVSDGGVILCHREAKNNCQSCHELMAARSVSVFLAARHAVSEPFAGC